MLVLPVNQLTSNPMENTITMTTKEAERYDIIQRLIKKEIDGTQAATAIGLSVRQTKRIKARVIKEKESNNSGIQGVIHKNRGRKSNNKIDAVTLEEAIKTIKDNYLDFSSQLTYEKLQENHNCTLSYATVRRIRIKEGLSKVKSRKANKKHFSQRDRKPSYGEMVQHDGSYHNWLEGRCTDKEMKHEQCLLLSVDDATGTPMAKLAKNESIKEVFKFWKEYIKEKGKPTSIYLDKFSTYKVNHKNAVDNKDFRTQFQRAMEDELGIQVIFANTPQAKGRVERMNATWQDRLVKELRLAKINNIEDTNEFIKKEFIPEFKKKFNVKAKKKGDLHRKLSKTELTNLDHIFSVKNIRKVRNDFVVQYKNRYFQLKEIQKNTTVYKKDEVIVEEHLNGDIYLCKKTVTGDKYLDFIELSSKPVKEIDIKLPAVTRSKTTYIPPANHPWRNQAIFKAQQKFKESKI
jgi:hypothetical protein